MTICLIAKAQCPKTGEVFITAASDSEVGDLEGRLCGIVNSSKLFKVGTCVIAVSGSSAIAEVLEDIQEDKQFLDQLDLCSRKGIRQLATHIYSYLKELSEFSITPEVVQHVGPLLIASPVSLFKVYPDLSAYSFESFTASGLGEEVASGALDYAFEHVLKKKEELTQEDLDAIVIQCVAIANKRVIHCGGEIHVAYPSKECKPPVKRRKRKFTPKYEI